MTYLEKWNNIEEKVWKQKSRVDGDSNTIFFHAYAKERRRQSTIKMLVKNDGTRMFTQDQIKSEVISFYKGLMGSSAACIPMVDRNVVSRGPALSSF